MFSTFVAKHDALLSLAEADKLIIGSGRF